MHALSSFFNASLLLVMFAAALDILANLLLARSHGFRRLRMGFTSLALVGLAFYCLSLAVRNMDLAVAYALWGSFGILGTSLGGWIFFKQKLTPSAFAGMVLLIAGVLLLQLP